MRNKLIVAAVVSGLALSGCATDPNTGQQRLNKTAIGTLAGALGGGAISKATGGDNTGRDAAIGAALGAGVGYYMERQAKQLEQQMAGTGVTVTPNANGNIDLVMPGNITFSFDDASLNIFLSLEISSSDNSSNSTLPSSSILVILPIFPSFVLIKSPIFGCTYSFSSSFLSSSG